MMNVDMKTKRQEAIKRMKMMQIFPEAIRQFKDDGRVMVSEPPFGDLSYITETERQEIDKFEQEYHALVYHVVRAYTNFGQLDSWLFVSDYPEEWDMENTNIEQNIVFTWTINRSVDWMSDMGSIAFRPANGGLLRVL